MKITGAQWNAYLASWPDGWWFDDSDETFDGKEPTTGNAPPDAVVQFSCGVILDERQNEIGGLVSHYKKWVKSQNTAFLLCEIPKEHEEALRSFLRDHGGKVGA